MIFKNRFGLMMNYTSKLHSIVPASGMIKNPRVEAVMLKVDRGNYCSSSHPYEDRPQYIGWGSTLSAPHMHSVAIELLEDRLVEGAKVLDIGCGSGFLTACFAHLVGQTGLVVGVDHIKELVEQAEENIRRDCEGLLSSGRIVLKVRDARVGLPEYEQFFDAIHVGASASPEQATKVSILCIFC